MLKVLFGSEARVKILALFMLNPSVDFYLREIAKRTGLPVRAVERTVKGLVDIGLLQREHRGNSVYFSVNREFPILAELKAIILKTIGLGDRLREVLSEEEGVKAAFIYGSYANNQEDLESDIDLFVVGSVSPRALTPNLAPLEGELGRPLNATVFTQGELRERIKNKDPFIASVFAGPKVFLVGSEGVLRSFVEG
jgi:predicted nucleotidyltransferase